VQRFETFVKHRITQSRAISSTHEEPERTIPITLQAGIKKKKNKASGTLTLRRLGVPGRSQSHRWCLTAAELLVFIILSLLFSSGC